MATTVAAPPARWRTSPVGADVAAVAVPLTLRALGDEPLAGAALLPPRSRRFALAAGAVVALAVNHLLLTAW